MDEDKAQEDYYELLGISTNATPKDIRTSYLTKAKYWHPDKNIHCHNKTEVKNMVQKLGEAYSILSEPEKRREYDWKSGNQDPGKTNSPSFYYDDELGRYCCAVQDTKTTINTCSLTVCLSPGTSKMWIKACEEMYKHTFKILKDNDKQCIAG